MGVGALNRKKWQKLFIKNPYTVKKTEIKKYYLSVMKQDIENIPTPGAKSYYNPRIFNENMSTFFREALIGFNEQVLHLESLK